MGTPAKAYPELIYRVRWLQRLSLLLSNCGLRRGGRSFWSCYQYI